MLGRVQSVGTCCHSLFFKAVTTVVSRFPYQCAASQVLEVHVRVVSVHGGQDAADAAGRSNQLLVVVVKC